MQPTLDPPDLYLKTFTVVNIQSCSKLATASHLHREHTCSAWACHMGLISAEGQKLVRFKLTGNYISMKTMKI